LIISVSDVIQTLHTSYIPYYSEILCIGSHLEFGKLATSLVWFPTSDQNFEHLIEFSPCISLLHICTGNNREKTSGKRCIFPTFRLFLFLRKKWENVGKKYNNLPKSSHDFSQCVQNFVTIPSYELHSLCCGSITIKVHFYSTFNVYL